MARVNVYLPDDLAAQAKQRDLPISQLAQRAIHKELDMQATITERPRLATLAAKIDWITVRNGEDEIPTKFQGTWIVHPDEETGSFDDTGVALTGRGRFVVYHESRYGFPQLHEFDTYDEL